MRADAMFQGNGDLLNDTIDNELDTLELMGYDAYSPELMGRVFGRLFRRIGARIRKRRGGKKGLVKRIISRIKKRRRARSKKGRGDDYGLSFRSPEGTATIGPEGLSYTDRMKMVRAGMVPPEPEGGGNIMAMITKNPMLLAIPAVVVLMFMMKKK